MTTKFYANRNLHKCSLKKGLPPKEKKLDMRLFDGLRASRRVYSSLSCVVNKRLLRLVSLLPAMNKKGNDHDR